jgi:hypothetical protein
MTGGAGQTGPHWRSVAWGATSLLEGLTSNGGSGNIPDKRLSRVGAVALYSVSRTVLHAKYKKRPFPTHRQMRKPPNRSKQNGVTDYVIGDTNMAKVHQEQSGGCASA